MVAEALDISTDPDVALSCSSGPYIAMLSNSSAGHSDMEASWCWIQVTGLTPVFFIVLSGTGAMYVILHANMTLNDSLGLDVTISVCPLLWCDWLDST